MSAGGKCKNDAAGEIFSGSMGWYELMPWEEKRDVGLVSPDVPKDVWLGVEDSNLGLRFQRPLSYH
jgi:hypothetical protein